MIQEDDQEGDMLKPKLGQQKRRYTIHLTEQQYMRWTRLRKEASKKGLRLVLSEELNMAFEKALDKAEKELAKLA